MKSIEDIYGPYMTKEIAEVMAGVANTTITMLKLVRNERVAKDLHDPKISYTVDALTHWEEMQKQYTEFLKDK